MEHHFFLLKDKLNNSEVILLRRMEDEATNKDFKKISYKYSPVLFNQLQISPRPIKSKY